jgi:DNA-binding NtrC family response regulator
LLPQFSFWGGDMPAQVVLVHNVTKFALEASAALRRAGYRVAVFTDPVKALDALDRAQTVEVLITRVNFPPGKPNGVSLALMTRYRRPNVRVIFTARAEMARHTQDIGELVPAPVSIPELVGVVSRLLPLPALT